MGACMPDRDACQRWRGLSWLDRAIVGKPYDPLRRVLGVLHDGMPRPFELAGLELPLSLHPCFPESWIIRPELHFL
jgi:hypothetical protein